MLPKEYRLVTKEIPQVAKMGKRLSSDLFDVKVWWDNSLDYPKFALAVGLKVSKSAVIRNTIKRKFRAALIEILKENQPKKGKYLIIAKSSDLSSINSKDIMQVLNNLLSK